MVGTERQRQFVTADMNPISSEGPTGIPVGFRYLTMFQDLQKQNKADLLRLLHLGEYIFILSLLSSRDHFWGQVTCNRPVY